MRSYSWLRCKHTISTNTELILAVCAVAFVLSTTVLLTGLITTPVQGSPFADSDEETQSFHAASVEQHATVEVTNDTHAFERGETLSDPSVYPLGNATDPELVSSAQVDNGRLRNLTVTVTYVASENRNGAEPFYRNDVVVDSVAGNDTAGELRVTIPVGDVLERRQQLAAEFGSGVTVSAELTSTIHYEYESPDGEVFARSLQAGGSIERVGNLYTFPTGSERTTHRTGSATDAGANGDPVLNSLFLFVALFALLLGTGTAASAKYIDATEVAQEIQWERFRDWVTEVESYTPQGDVNTVEVTNLNDLVNLAIDTNRRVLYHRPVDEYIVVENRVMYKFTPDETGQSGSTELFGLSEEHLEDPTFPEPAAFDGGESQE